MQHYSCPQGTSGILCSCCKGNLCFLLLLVVTTGVAGGAAAAMAAVAPPVNGVALLAENACKMVLPGAASRRQGGLPLTAAASIGVVPPAAEGGRRDKLLRETITQPCGPCSTQATEVGFSQAPHSNGANR